MTQREQAQLETAGFVRTHASPGLTGARLWWKRTGSSMDICRQRDGATKHQDLGDGHPALPDDTPASNRQWALDLVSDPLTDWRTN
jgi:hypothetical protein